MKPGSKAAAEPELQPEKSEAAAEPELQPEKSEPKTDLVEGATTSDTSSEDEAMTEDPPVASVSRLRQQTDRGHVEI